MLGPGAYCPDPTEGITRPEDLPKPHLVQQSRNFKHRSCPRCGKSSYRDRVFTRTLHDVGDLYRSTVFWTPSGLKLGCISQGTLLLISHLGGCFVAMPPNQPGLIVLTLKRVQRQAQLFHGIKSCQP